MGERQSSPRANALLGPAIASCAYVISPGALAVDLATELEAGVVAERVTGGAGTHFGPSIALEVTPIAHWLELEIGVSRFQIDGATEWETGLTFKKPFDLSPAVELMIGLGPTWTRTNAATGHADSFGGEFSLDFQFWTGRRWGWYLEPGYSVGFDHGAERAFAITAGVLVAL